VASVSELRDLCDPIKIAVDDVKYTGYAFANVFSRRFGLAAGPEDSR
jgi:hypothetical protein